MNVLETGAGAGPLQFQPPYMPGLHQPIDLEVWKSVKMPQFSGLPGDFASFEKEWDEVERAARATVPYPISEWSLLLRYKGCLDAATQRRLTMRMEEDPI